MTLDRRSLIKRAGLLGAAGSAAAAATLVDGSDPAAAAATPITAENVKRHGAAGDGENDDAAAIQAALDAIPPDGGAVFFPPGDYLVSRRLAPKSQTLMFGSHTPRYHPVANPDSACKIRAAAGFSGAGLIEPRGETQGVTIRNLALVGDGANQQGGIRMPELADVVGEQAWTLENVTIAGFEHGIAGRVHVFSLLHCHIHSNTGWGIYAAEGNRWNDCHVANCFVYFNREGNLYFGGPESSAAVEFVNCRFERAGNRYGSPSEPLNPQAPGVKLERARFLSFTNCYTDANTGNGVEILGSADALRSLHFTACIFSRDGTGDGRRLGPYAGVAVRGARSVSFANCLVGTGASDDDGGGLVGPAYGVSYEDSEDFQWIGGRAEGVTSSWRAADNRRPTIVDVPGGMLTLPLERPDEAVSDGMAYFDAASNRLFVRSGSTWRSVSLT